MSMERLNKYGFYSDSLCSGRGKTDKRRYLLVFYKASLTVNLL